MTRKEQRIAAIELLRELQVSERHIVDDGIGRGGPYESGHCPRCHQRTQYPLVTNGYVVGGVSAHAEWCQFRKIFDADDASFLEEMRQGVSGIEQ